MLKMTGIIMAFTASMLIGMYKESKLKERKVLLEEFREYVQNISAQIQYFKEPLPVIFRKLSQKSGRFPQMLSMVMECYSSMDIRKEKSLELIWKESVNSVYKDSPMEEEDLSLFMKFGDFFNQSDRCSLNNFLTLLDESLDRQIAKAGKAILTKGRVYRGMGISIGALIAIVLI